MQANRSHIQQPGSGSPSLSPLRATRPPCQFGGMYHQNGRNKMCDDARTGQTAKRSADLLRMKPTPGLKPPIQAGHLSRQQESFLKLQSGLREPARVRYPVPDDEQEADPAGEHWLVHMGSTSRFDNIPLNTVQA